MKVSKRIASLASLCAVAVAAAFPAQAQTFVDPAARLVGSPNIALGDEVYVAPFAQLRAPGVRLTIRVGNQTNIQDSVMVDAATGPIVLGDQVILAHGATVKGPAQLGTSGECPVLDPPAADPNVCPSFVGFNAVVDGAIIEKNAMVSALARVGPGVTIPSGRKVPSGFNITTNEEVAARTVPVLGGDLAFMAGVIAVNLEFAAAYAEMAAVDRTKVLGINVNPITAFDPEQVAPTIAGVPTVDPTFPNRIIGDVRIPGNTVNGLKKVMGAQISLRADEGHPFLIQSIASMASNTTFHALETTDLATGANGRFGFHSVVHGGGAAGEMVAGDNLSVGDWAVLFRSTVGNDVSIGYKSLVQQANLPDGTVVPDCTVIILSTVSLVEWCDITP